MSHKTVTIAICTYNRADYLRDTLSDIAGQECDAARFDMLVVNNNSTDHTETVCREFAEKEGNIFFRHVSESKQGLSHARNRAVEESDGETVLFIDDDVILPETFLSSVIKKMSANPDVPCAGGKILVHFDDGDPGWIPSELMPMFGLHDLGGKARLYPSGNFPRGGNMLIRRELFEKTGLFRTDLGRAGSVLLGSEEKEFFERARKHGAELHYWPEMELWHRIGSARLTTPYIKSQSVGIGASERLRVKGAPVRAASKLASELVKLGGSLLLAAGYLIKGKAKAAGFLLRFRMWVLKGFAGRPPSI